jgi:hypothetical protein
MSGLLARAAGAEDLLTADPLAELSKGTDVLRPLMPFATAFQLLRAPLTAHGAGGRLKRERSAARLGHKRATLSTHSQTLQWRNGPFRTWLCGKMQDLSAPAC